MIWVPSSLKPSVDCCIILTHPRPICSRGSRINCRAKHCPALQMRLDNVRSRPPWPMRGQARRSPTGGSGRSPDWIKPVVATAGGVNSPESDGPGLYSEMRSALVQGRQPGRGRMRPAGYRSKALACRAWFRALSAPGRLAMGVVAPSNESPGMTGVVAPSNESPGITARRIAVAVPIGRSVAVAVGLIAVAVGWIAVAVGWIAVPVAAVPVWCGCKGTEG
jgi:hypothetical protein